MKMFETAAIASIFIFGFYYFYMIVKLLSGRKERILMIEKISAMDCDNMPKHPLKIKGYLHTGSGSALKGACLLIGLGVGLLLGFMFMYLLFERPGMMHGDVTPDFVRQIKDYEDVRFMIIAASVLIFGGIGLLASFFLERKLEKEEK